MNDLSLTSIAASYLTTTIKEGVLTVTMNRPDKLNGWTMGMMEAIREAFEKANHNDSVKVLLFTGSGKYYCAGVNLSGTIKLMPPRKLRQLIVNNNRTLFEIFLNFTKPLLIAVNGPAIGASVTSSTLANFIIASENATFSTPFSALSVTPEGCSSYHFPRLIGENNTYRMMGPEGWKPNAKEALDIGLVQQVVPATHLLSEAERIAHEWVAKGETRQFLADSQLADLKATNAKESEDLADAFLSAGFLKGQCQFLWRKKKYVPSTLFFSLWALRPLWSWAI